MPDSFVHLHVHSEYSMLDGAAKMAALVAEVSRLGMPAVAVTDHGNMYGSDDFYQQATKAGIKPIIGIEAYVAPESRFHKKPVFWGHQGQRGVDEFGEGGDVSGAGAYTHMTMWARDSTGVQNLFKLSSLASMEGQYRKPRVDRDLLAENAEGIIATTGCPSGEVQTRLRLGQKDEALQAASDYRDIFGQDNFYVELMDHGLVIERSVREGLLDIAKQLGLRTVATNDSHYVTKDQAESHAALLCVQSGKTLSDPTRFKFDGDGYYLKSAEEMRAYWDTEVPGAADTTLWIAEQINPYNEVWEFRDRMPRISTPEGKTEPDMLREEVIRLSPTRFPRGLPEGYQEQIDWELEVIGSKGYSSYFMVVGDLVRYAKAQGYRVGPGRGSAAGSLVAYLLHITDLDPIQHSLIFERFLNPERDSPPDIDIDFDDRGRSAVMRYVIDKYGAEHVANVITFGTIKTKAALKDAARVHHGQAGFAIADRIAKALPPPVGQDDIPLAGITDPEHERYPEAAEVRALIETDPEAKQIYDTALGLEGLIRNAGVHACAVIMSSEPLLGIIPLWMRDDGAIITGWDYPSCEAIGLLKMDFLGLSNLNTIGDAIQAVKDNHGVEIDTSTLALDDKATYELLSSGNGLGIFQLDSAGMRDLLKRIQPSHFGDISAALALYRPGPMAVGAHLAYAARSTGKEKITPIHPDLEEALEPILGETYHLMVYQEQVMEIARKLAGYSFGEADLLRKAMGKKKPEILAKEESKFLAGMKKNGFSDEASRTLWEVMVPFAGYGFNKSHTAGYALVSYWTAYLKANYPAEFMAALLSGNTTKPAKMALYLAECRRMGIKVLTPDVNESKAEFAAVDGNIRCGLAGVRNVGHGVVEEIIDARQQQGRFTSFEDFLTKVPASVCSKKVVESLIKAGAFDGLGVTRLSLMRVYEDAIDIMAGMKKAQSAGQFDLFGPASEQTEKTSPLSHLTYIPEEYNRKDLLSYERDMLGLYVSAHPLDGAEHLLRRAVRKSIGQLLAEPPAEGEVQVAGLITEVDRRVNKKGEPWAIATVEDVDGVVEVLFFSKSYLVNFEHLVQDSAVMVKGRVNWRDETMSVFAAVAEPIDISSAEHLPSHGPLPYVVKIAADRVTPDTVMELRSSLVAHRGRTPVHLVLCGERGETTFVLDEYSVEPSSLLLGELKGIPGVNVQW